MRVPLVTCVGEAIVDFVATESGSPLKDARQFLKAAGGAPANVAVGIARLGTPSGFVGSVGNDPFGRFLHDRLRAEGVDVRGLRFDATRNTRLAFVSLTESGNRDFAFWERHPADEVLSVTASDLRRISRSRFVHISSFMLLKQPARNTIFRLVKLLRKSGTQISFDPNLRLPLWQSMREARQVMMKMIELSSMVKLNRVEAAFLTGKKFSSGAAASLLARGPGLVVVTAGERGCSYYSRRGVGSVPGFAVQTVDTTGCGDAFLAALLHKLCNDSADVADLSVATLGAACRYANAVGALASREFGAMTVPAPVVIDEFLRER